MISSLQSKHLIFYTEFTIDIIEIDYKYIKILNKDLLKKKKNIQRDQERRLKGAKTQKFSDVRISFE